MPRGARRRRATIEPGRPLPTVGGAPEPGVAALPTGVPARTALPDLSLLGREPLLNRERAARLMAAAGLDALVCTRAANVYYLTNVWPLRDRQGGYGSDYAVLPRDPQAPATLFRVVDPARLGARELHRRSTIESMPRFDVDARRARASRPKRPPEATRTCSWSSTACTRPATPSRSAEDRRC